MNAAQSHLVAIRTMGVFRYKSAGHRTAGFINPEAAVLGTILLVVAMFLLPFVYRIHMNGVRGKGLIIFSWSLLIIGFALLTVHFVSFRKLNKQIKNRKTVKKPLDDTKY